MAAARRQLILLGYLLMLVLLSQAAYNGEYSLDVLLCVIKST